MTDIAPTDAAPADAAPTPRKSEEITLGTPIVRGETTIAKITLRKPKSGELRGLSLAEIQNAHAAAILNLLPRIAMPLITQQEADNLEPEDLIQCAGAIVNFLMTPDQQAMLTEFLKG